MEKHLLITLRISSSLEQKKNETPCKVLLQAG